MEFSRLARKVVVANRIPSVDELNRIDSKEAFINAFGENCKNQYGKYSPYQYILLCGIFEKYDLYSNTFVTKGQNEGRNLLRQLITELRQAFIAFNDKYKLFKSAKEFNHANVQDQFDNKIGEQVTFNLIDANMKNGIKTIGNFVARVANAILSGDKLDMNQGAGRKSKWGSVLNKDFEKYADSFLYQHLRNNIRRLAKRIA